MSEQEPQDIYCPHCNQGNVRDYVRYIPLYSDSPHGLYLCPICFQLVKAAVLDDIMRHMAQVIK